MGNPWVNIPSQRAILLEKMTLLSDDPEKNNIRFGFEKLSNQISTLLQSENMIWPFTIGIHAAWGMGKTTLLDLTMSKIEEDASLKTIKFNAWEYERNDIVLSLLQKIEKKCTGIDEKKIKKLTNIIGKLAVDVALRHTVNMRLEEIKDHFTEQEKTILTLREILKEVLGETKLIIFIDDLDRCLADNILNMLEAIKMFFNIPNIVVVIATDITKIQRAWELRYDSKIGKIEGRDHIDKLFPLILPIPEKQNEELSEYVKNLVPSMTDSDINFLLQNTHGNPRKIKKILNLLYFVVVNYEDRGHNAETINDNFEIDLRIIIGWISLTLNHPTIAKKIHLSPRVLVRLAIICNRIDDISTLIEMMEFLFKNPDSSWTGEKLVVNHNSFDKTLLELLNDVENEQESFKILKHFGDGFNYEQPNMEKFSYNSEDVEKLTDNVIKPIKNIISNVGILGV